MNNCSDPNPKEKCLKDKLRDLQSLTFHAEEVKQDIQTLLSSLRDQSIEPGAYPVRARLDVNLANTREIYAGSDDILIREFTITSLQRKAAIVFVAGMTNQKTLEHVLSKLTIPQNSLPGLDDLERITNTLLSAAEITEECDMQQIVKKVLSGFTVLFVDGITTAILVGTRQVESRPISEPETEATVRGPRDGFTEELEVNLTLLRRRVLDPNLVIKKWEVGVRSHTEAAFVYFRGITNPELVNEVERRLKRINVDMPIGTGMIQTMIEDHPYSPFPLTMATERPDKFIASIMEGRVGLILNGTPFSLIVPATLFDFFQASDDYYEKWITASAVRFLRYFTACIATFTPALFIAVTTFHPGLIPTPLTLTIAIAHLGIPFPTFLETLTMVIMLEIMQEAGVRLPKTVGPAVSIVGGLVIGEAAVRAGIVSSPIIIVTAITAIASFTVANYRISMPIRLFRLLLMVLAASFGMFGLILGIIAILIHLNLLESFGEPYLAPLVPKNLSRIGDLKDTLVVAPLFSMQDRPQYLEPLDKTRQD